jgi:hypothetical protein
MGKPYLPTSTPLIFGKYSKTISRSQEIGGQADHKLNDWHYIRKYLSLIKSKLMSMMPENKRLAYREK